MKNKHTNEVYKSKEQNYGQCSQKSKNVFIRCFQRIRILVLHSMFQMRIFFSSVVSDLALTMCKTYLSDFLKSNQGRYKQEVQTHKKL